MGDTLLGNDKVKINNRENLPRQCRNGNFRSELGNMYEFYLLSLEPLEAHVTMSEAYAIMSNSSIMYFTSEAATES